MKNETIQKDLTILKELFSQVLSHEIYRSSRLRSDALKYFHILERHCEHRGAQSMVLWAKRVYHASLNAMLGQPDPGYPFLATHKGWPKKVRFLRNYCFEGPEGKRMVLSILSSYRALVVPGIPDLGSITEPGIPVSQEIIDNISGMVKPIPFELSSPEYQYRSKHGPNGPAVYTAGLDVQALSEGPLLGVLKGFLKLQNANSIVEDIEQIQKNLTELKKPAIHSRLDQKVESGGKVRIFAVCDFWSQLALKPLHNAVAQILQRMPQDFTWNQEGISARIQEWRAKGFTTFHSIDLSSATDRFPAILQKSIVKKLIGAEFSEYWYNLMTQRIFKSPWGDVKYAVGQPMGAYSSWPVFAFSHHMVMRFAAKRVGIFKPDYAIVGDDVVIPGEKLAREYRSVLKELGVSISESKSLYGNHIEFCKRIWTGFQEITPLPAKLLLQSVYDYRNLISLNKWLCTRGAPNKLRDILLTALIPRNRNKKRLILIGLSAPYKGWVWSGAQFSDELRWPSPELISYYDIIREVSLTKALSLFKELQKVIQNYVSNSYQKGVPGISAGTQGEDWQPMNRVLSTLPVVAASTVERINQTMLTEDGANPWEALSLVRVFDPRVLLPKRSKYKNFEFSFHPLVYSLAISGEFTIDNSEAANPNDGGPPPESGGDGSP